ncbi:MAG: hypothetical protein ACYS9X_11640 [Planctomycetota bacterium]|jgi:hypothetical protein
MHDPELFVLFTRPLDEAGLTYMVTGSVAAMVYGEPRLTNDIDIVLELGPARAAELATLFPAAQFYCPPEEVLLIEAGRAHRGHFNLIHHATGYKADVYLRGKDPLRAWGLSRRRRLDLGEEESMWVAPPEYVIVRKLEFYREGGSAKHVADVQGVLEVSGDSIDMISIGEWVDRLGLGNQWAEARGE